MRRRPRLSRIDLTKIKYIPEVLLLYRIHKSNLRPTIVSDDTNKGITEFYLKHGINRRRNQFMKGKNNVIINFLKNVQLFIIEFYFSLMLSNFG